MIRNFIYLDEPKLYSFSSQLFEGITDFILNEKSLDTENNTTVKVGLPSSKIIADVIRETSTSTTKKFLHDHSFSLLEQELIKTEQLLDITENQLTIDDISNSGKSFIKIKAKGKFIDTNEIMSTLKNFNDIGEAIVKAQAIDELKELDRKRRTLTTEKQVKQLQSTFNKEVEKIAYENEYRLPPEMISSFTQLVEFFGADLQRFQQIGCNNTIFTSCLDSSHLRDSLPAIYRKYSRKTALEFVVVGTISHGIGTQKPEVQELPDDANMLQHFQNMVEHMYDLDQNAFGKLDNEIIIEPIAIYTEL
ncbi:hypothetical protein PVK64_00055 [Aliivibrio sp. S4TY2]|uniref:DUF6414 family protein n=1 Tax=unclassified Aliivibrio TaxID=2645654 RepID=UPI0023786871|nr:MULTISPECIES: hypothetical protein [unclassified Aliivibrio]MDD9154579.1 hypothetical protein [Aliivibrio sp. S4TY2]MDD9159058.1 hypothetical protein [Aliivibrio sp. S4TY1]MDD9162582.1 hypothetical protein [Aliivibrio sp. S4MY2]MDD9167057.1 hypothetical protein [Aliivibrio sp. S4MY4]MDD9183659.1 hypothetical protein [Aliivibrio sp. S4MY3]